MASWTLVAERISPGIFSSRLWHWSSMKFTPESGASAPAATISFMMRKSW